MTTATRPAWATEIIEPDKNGENGWHRRTITIGDANVTVQQYVDNTGPNPVEVVLPDDYGEFNERDAQQCRDLAAALLEAAGIIEAAAA